MCIRPYGRAREFRVNPVPTRHLRSDGQALSNQICARICARDVAGRVEMRETPWTGHERLSSVRRGQRGDQRLRETAETCVVWLITQRSRVQIPPPLPRQRPSFEQEEGLLHVVCKRICTRAPAQAAPSLVPPASSATSMEMSDPPMISSASVFATWRSAIGHTRVFERIADGLDMPDHARILLGLTIADSEGATPRGCPVTPSPRSTASPAPLSTGPTPKASTSGSAQPSNCSRIGANSDRVKALPAIARGAQRSSAKAREQGSRTRSGTSTPLPAAWRDVGGDTQCHARDIPTSTLLYGGSG